MRVSTKGPVDLPIEYRWTARELGHALWNDGVEDTDAVRAPFTAEDPTEGWDESRVDVDGSAVLFKMLGSDRSWVAFAVVRRSRVGEIRTPDLCVPNPRLRVLHNPLTCVFAGQRPSPSRCS